MRLFAQEIGHFLVAMMFLTRLPAPQGLAHSEGRLARSARYFPLVGVLVGLIAGLGFYLAASALAAPVAAGLALVAGVAVTGALHEDGLADTCDGLSALPDRERALEIMRDSRVGSYGVLGLVLSLGLRWASLSVLSPINGLIALVVAHSISRATLTPVMTSGRYARTRGLANSVAGGVKPGEALVAILLATIVAMIAGPVAGLVALAAAVVAAGLVLSFVMRALGGYTGDSLGAIQQVTEIAVLITLSALMT